MRTSSFLVVTFVKGALKTSKVRALIIVAHQRKIKQVIMELFEQLVDA